MNAAARYGLSVIHRQWMARLSLGILGMVVALLTLVAPQQKALRQERLELRDLSRENEALMADPQVAGQTQHLLEMEAAYEAIFRQWNRQRQRYNVLPSLDEVGAEARIDFKVALQEAREKIHQESIARGFEYPGSLGMTETIAAEENTETRMRQLQSGMRTAELCLEQEVTHVQSFRPLAPRAVLAASATNSLWAVSYPFEAQISCRYDQLVKLLDALRSKDRFYSLISLTATHPGPENPDMLAVRMVLGLGRLQAAFPGKKAPAASGSDTTEPMPLLIEEGGG